MVGNDICVTCTTCVVNLAWYLLEGHHHAVTASHFQLESSSEFGQKKATARLAGAAICNHTE
eukprot:1832333-Amphidinium_carterae.1